MTNRHRAKTHEPEPEALLSHEAPNASPHGARDDAIAAAPDHWLVFIYRVPQDPASRRTYVWRKLKQLGAVYLQQAAAVLPGNPAARAALEELAAHISGFDGEASLLEAKAPSDEWARALIERFNQARDDEYSEITETVARLEEEIGRETSRTKFTFAELEEVEADWERIRRWHERVRARDTFVASGGPGAASSLDAARRSLDAFMAEVYRREGLTDADPDESGDGRSD